MAPPLIPIFSPQPGSCQCWHKKKKEYNIKFEHSVLLIWFSEDLSPSWITVRDSSKEVGEQPGYTGVLQQKPGGQNLQRLLFIKENRPLKLMNLLLFFVWEDGRVWAHWNHSFDMHLSSLGPVSYSCPSWLPSGAPWGVAAVAEGSTVATPVCLPVEVPQSSPLGSDIG